MIVQTSRWLANSIQAEQDSAAPQASSASLVGLQLSEILVSRTPYWRGT
jgi:hypothetical protein